MTSRRGGDARRIRLAETAVAEGRTLHSRLDPDGPRRSVGGLLRDNLARFPHRAALRAKRDGVYADLTWSDLAARAAALARFLGGRGVGPGDRVAVISRNRPEMLVTEFAVMGLGAIYVPLFAGYSGEQTRELLDQAEPAVLFASDAAQLAKIGDGGSARIVVAYEAIPHEAVSGVAGEFCVFDKLASRRARGDAGPTERAGNPDEAVFLERAAAVDPDSPCLMMYTSGTAGRQKGVLLTHENILSQQRALDLVWDLGPGDRFLSFLPWHHSFGGIFEKFAALAAGAPLALDESYGKDFDLLLRNWKAIRPTVYFSVPMIHQQLVTHVRTHPEDEAAIFHPEIRFVFTAAAPLPSNIAAYYAERGIPVVEGWGLTETSPCCTLTDLEEPRSVPGVVGYPIPGVALALADDGEILVRGPNVMRGYFRDEEANARALPGDGWFHTGDLGEFVGEKLKLLSRKDRVFKLLNAEKVVPSVLENRLAGGNRYIEHAIVVGSGRRNLAALIFPNYFLIREEFGEDREAAVRAVKASFAASIRELNAANPVKYEHLAAFAVVDRELSVEGGELTPSMKVRVHDVLERDAAYLEAIYDPSEDCDCSFLSKVMRLAPDPRRCPRGRNLTLDRCHECGSFLSSMAPK